MSVRDKRRIDAMLSSTFRDLKQHRAAIIAAMNGLQLTPLAQEFDAALSDSDLIKASLDKVEAADVYVGLIGSRYGQRPECRDRNADRLSLTELEYRRAVERGLPRLMFIMADDHELTLADLKLSQEDGDEGRRLQQPRMNRRQARMISCQPPLRPSTTCANPMSKGKASPAAAQNSNSWTDGPPAPMRCCCSRPSAAWARPCSPGTGSRLAPLPCAAIGPADSGTASTNRAPISMTSVSRRSPIFATSGPRHSADAARWISARSCAASWTHGLGF